MRLRRHIYGLIILAALLTIVGRAIYQASLECDRTDARIALLHHRAE